MLSVDKKNIPQHIAIIMDGNRRWARAHNLPDYKGHEAGAQNLERITEAASKLGVKILTVYALSTENITERAKREVKAIFNIARYFYVKKMPRLISQGVRVNILGEEKGLPKAIRTIVDKLRATYIKNESIELNIALNYGGKKELLTAIKKILQDGISLEKIKEEDIDKRLYTKGQPDPELVIRTGGRSRLSNFLLWQSAYSELYFTNKYWPDFTQKDLEEAIVWYQTQKRNFGS